MEINIKPSDAAKYLGIKNPGEEIFAEISGCIEEIKRAASPKSVFGVYKIKRDGENSALENTSIKTSGTDFLRRLNGCGKCIVFAVTLGAGVDKLIKYTQSIDMPRAVILDAAATAAVESLADKLESTLTDGQECTKRFSCGYGDTPLSLQPQILGALDAGAKIGLYCNDSFIMLPRKSVTAFIGIK